MARSKTRPVSRSTPLKVPRSKAGEANPNPSTESGWIWGTKGREVAGVALLALGLLLLASLLSYHPRDESLLQASGGIEQHNWIGPVGAQLSALLLGFVGLPAFALAVAAIVAGGRRLRKAKVPAVAGRGIGLLVVLLVSPPLLQVVIGEIQWKGEALRSGGVLGLLLGDGLEGKVGWLGAILVLFAGLVGGVALVVQSSLEELVRDWWAMLRNRTSEGRLALERRRERREREKSRERVMEKHIERADERRRKVQIEGIQIAGLQTEEEREPAPARPVRVMQRSGSSGFSIQKVDGARHGSSGSLANQAEEFGAGRIGVGQPPEVSDASLGAESISSRPKFLRAPDKAREKALVGVKPGRASKPVSAPKAQPELFERPDDPYALPPVNLLSQEKTRQPISEDNLVRMGEAISERCAEFGVKGSVDAITPGPVITVFEFQPAPGVKVSQIVNLSDDLALALKAESIRIDRIPGRSTLGIEVPNHDRAIIHLGPMLANENFQNASSPLTMALGSTLHGEPFYSDLAKMPHLLVAGATGAGKSVGLQSMITSIIYKAHRDQVKFIFIDPKRIELGVYSSIPHLKTEVVVEPKKASNALRWAVSEMERRYRLLAEVHVRSIDFYNRAIADPEVQKRISLRDDDEEQIDMSDFKSLPYMVIIIDELADLMMVSSSEVEHSIARLAQMARAVGIHLIVATQRPSVDVLTGTIKANFPCRIAFATASRHDSRTILDQVGSEKLLGRGDMLFLPPGSSRPLRLHGAYVSEQETAGLIRWLKRLGKPDLDLKVLEAPKEEKSGRAGAVDDLDPLFDDAARLVVSEGSGSASFLQRRMRVGFSRAARLIDMLADDGILGPAQGSKPREVLVPANYFDEVDATHHE